MRLMNCVMALLFAAAFSVAGVGVSSASLLISINKSTQRMTVTVDGVPRYTWPVSTGGFGYATPSGSYKPFRMEREHFSTEWDDAPMPHSIFFTSRGHAIHGSYHTRNLGRPVSHGCVRLAPMNAARLFALVEAEGMANTRVVVTGPGIALPKLNLPTKLKPLTLPKLQERPFADWLNTNLPRRQ